MERQKQSSRGQRPSLGIDVHSQLGCLVAIKTLNSLALFPEHEPSFSGLRKALSAATSVLQKEHRESLTMPALENWFKPIETTRRMTLVAPEVIDLTTESVEHHMNVANM